MSLPRIFPLLFILFTAPLTAEPTGVTDDFSAADHPTRQASRGEWVYQDGVAFCESDPELYKEYKNHGPILRWPCELIDGAMQFDVKPEGCQRLVITFNGDGHIFRITMRDDEGSRVIGWIEKSSKENKGDILTQIPSPKIIAIDGQWIKVSLEMTEGGGRLQLGDYTANLDHESLARLKQEFTISFASGSCAVREVSVQATNS